MQRVHSYTDCRASGHFSLYVFVCHSTASLAQELKFKNASSVLNKQRLDHRATKISQQRAFLASGAFGAVLGGEDTKVDYLLLATTSTIFDEPGETLTYPARPPH